IGRLHAWILRSSRGRLRRSVVLAGGQPVLALTTTGRRSGEPRTTTVAYLERGDEFVVSALNLGSDRHPAWCLNLRASPLATVHVGGKEVPVRAREAEGVEAELLWEALIARLPQSANTRRVARREVPVIVLEPLRPGEAA
ncbi:MAG TPA: nitroreductase/quinone reductase family protein, partial [Solirubrobacteraceae bacterium]|nr:nitroreductase/quinone reductase family protein [Solirubrobacteraceae bacterium]